MASFYMPCEMGFSLDYTPGLELGEAQKTYSDVLSAFRRVRRHYSSSVGVLETILDMEDKALLSECAGVLMRLFHEASVQEEMGRVMSMKGGSMKGGFQKTLYFRVQKLGWEILAYMGYFRNSGVKLGYQQSVHEPIA